MQAMVKWSFDMSKYECWICETRENLVLVPCSVVPKHLRGFTPRANKPILTTVCSKCIENEANYD
jgi:hypothetical protein